MNQSSERVVRFLTGKENIEDVSISDVQKLADESPFFPVAQFLLAKKLKTGNHLDFLSQVQKTALYSFNPFWLHFQLVTEKQEKIFYNNDDFSNRILITAKEEVAESEEDLSQTSTVNLIEKESYTEETASQPEEEMAAITRDSDAATELFLNEEANAEANADTDDNKKNLAESNNASDAETKGILEETALASAETNQKIGAFFNTPETLVPEDITQSSFVDKEFLSDNLAEDNKETEEQDEHEKMFQNIKAMLDATSEEAAADTDNAVIPIDPYYTIDYFAAQGIKLDLDTNPKDDLGKHLKKFTQWLKQMKKLGPEDAAEIISRRETDADIQKIADSSNLVREVVTEAMASVLEKQGKKEKAVELYNKLSFLNPDKSAYFAVKIKNLKGS